MRAFSSGVLLAPNHTAQVTVGMARLAEELGYDSVWVADEGTKTRDVFVTMTAIATATQNLRIGTGLVNPYTRHPALTAAAIASIDELSGGRAFLVYGAGGSLSLGPLGIERDKPLLHVREALQVCRRLFDGETVTFEGETLTLRNVHLDYARPGIGIWFAGRSPLLLAHAGAAAEGALLEFLHIPSLGTYVEQVASGARAAGRPCPHLLYSTCVITDRDRLDSIRPHMTYRLVDSPQAVKDQLGITPKHVAEIREALTGGLQAAAHLIPDRWIEPFVIIGSPDECAAQIATITDSHGFEGFVLLLADHERASEEIEMGADILARVRSSS
jgi:5,10-methylenetetrahydromethanopterin reductase